MRNFSQIKWALMASTTVTVFRHLFQSQSRFFSPGSQLVPTPEEAAIEEKQRSEHLAQNL